MTISSSVPLKRNGVINRIRSSRSFTLSQVTNQALEFGGFVQQLLTDRNQVIHLLSRKTKRRGKGEKVRPPGWIICEALEVDLDDVWFYAPSKASYRRGTWGSEAMFDLVPESH